MLLHSSQPYTGIFYLTFWNFIPLISINCSSGTFCSLWEIKSNCWVSYQCLYGITLSCLKSCSPSFLGPHLFELFAIAINQLTAFVPLVVWTYFYVLYVILTMDLLLYSLEVPSGQEVKGGAPSSRSEVGLSVSPPDISSLEDKIDQLKANISMIKKFMVR